MIDPKLLRTAAAEVADNLSRRNFSFDAETSIQCTELSCDG